MLNRYHWLDWLVGLGYLLIVPYLLTVAFVGTGAAMIFGWPILILGFILWIDFTNDAAEMMRAAM